MNISIPIELLSVLILNHRLSKIKEALYLIPERESQSKDAEVHEYRYALMTDERIIRTALIQSEALLEKIKNSGGLQVFENRLNQISIEMLDPDMVGAMASSNGLCAVAPPWESCDCLGRLPLVSAFLCSAGDGSDSRG